MPDKSDRGRKRAVEGTLVTGYDPMIYMPVITIDQWGDSEDERAVVYPDRSLVKSTRSQACFEVESYLGKGKHKVKAVGRHDTAVPDTELDGDRIYGLADNRCLLVVHGEEVLYSAKFDMFKDVVDDLLGNLTDDRIAEFSESDDFRFYQRMMSDGLVVPYKERKKFTSIVDSLLGHLPEEDIMDFMDTDDFVIYKDVAGHYRVGG